MFACFEVLKYFSGYLRVSQQVVRSNEDRNEGQQCALNLSSPRLT